MEIRKNQLYDYLYDCGAALVGVADMSMDKNITYPKAISVVIPVPVDIVRSLKTAPTKGYYNTYNEMNDSCPAEALSGTLWEAGMERSKLFDEWKCYHKQVQIMLEQTGIKKDLCGKCFAVCAFTQKYIGE